MTRPWLNVLLGEFITLKRGYDLPKRDRVFGQFPIVSSSGITGFHFQKKVEGPGVVTGRYGTLGKVFYIEQDFWPLNTSLYVRDFKKSHRRFVSYLLTTLAFSNQNVAGAVPGINRNYLHMLRIRVPSYPTQRKIASILSAYDDLIENNLRRIKILEEMAQNLYREWFVKFRFPGHEKVKFVDSPLGKIPEGWEVKPFGELCSRLHSGGTPSRKKPQFWHQPSIDWYKTRELWDNFLFDSEEKISIEGLQGSSARMFEPGTILMAIYGSPTVGRLGIVTKEATCNQAALGIVADSSQVSQQYLFYVLFELRRFFNSIAQGAAQQNISKTTVAKTLCILPPKTLINPFTDSILPIWTLLENLQSTIRNLRQTRDLLLPKLISGKLDVSDLDIKVPEDTA